MTMKSLFLAVGLLVGSFIITRTAAQSCAVDCSNKQMVTRNDFEARGPSGSFVFTSDPGSPIEFGATVFKGGCVSKGDLSNTFVAAITGSYVQFQFSEQIEDPVFMFGVSTDSMPSNGVWVRFKRLDGTTIPGCIKGGTAATDSNGRYRISKQNSGDEFVWDTNTNLGTLRVATLQLEGVFDFVRVEISSQVTMITVAKEYVDPPSANPSSMPSDPPPTVSPTTASPLAKPSPQPTTPFPTTVPTTRCFSADCRAIFMSTFSDYSASVAIPFPTFQPKQLSAQKLSDNSTFLFDAETFSPSCSSFNEVGDFVAPVFPIENTVSFNGNTVTEPILYFGIPPLASGSVIKLTFNQPVCPLDGAIASDTDQEVIVTSTKLLTIPTEGDQEVAVGAVLVQGDLESFTVNSDPAGQLKFMAIGAAPETPPSATPTTSAPSYTPTGRPSSIPTAFPTTAGPTFFPTTAAPTFSPTVEPTEFEKPKCKDKEYCDKITLRNTGDYSASCPGCFQVGQIPRFLSPFNYRASTFADKCGKSNERNNYSFTLRTAGNKFNISFGNVVENPVLFYLAGTGFGLVDPSEYKFNFYDNKICVIDGAEQTDPFRATIKSNADRRRFLLFGNTYVGAIVILGEVKSFSFSTNFAMPAFTFGWYD